MFSTLFTEMNVLFGNIIPHGSYQITTRIPRVIRSQLVVPLCHYQITTRCTPVSLSDHNSLYPCVIIRSQLAVPLCHYQITTRCTPVSLSDHNSLYPCVIIRSQLVVPLCPQITTRCTSYVIIRSQLDVNFICQSFINFV